MTCCITVAYAFNCKYLFERCEESIVFLHQQSVPEQYFQKDHAERVGRVFLRDDKHSRSTDTLKLQGSLALTTLHSWTASITFNLEKPTFGFILWNGHHKRFSYIRK